MKCIEILKQTLPKADKWTISEMIERFCPDDVIGSNLKCATCIKGWSKENCWEKEFINE